MRLEKVSRHETLGFIARCQKCEATIRCPSKLEPTERDIFADLDGAAGTYYCDDCVIECAFCKAAVFFEDTYSPGDEAICEACNGGVDRTKLKRMREEAEGR